MQMPDPETTRGRTIRSQIVGDHRLRHEAKFLQQLAHQFERGGPIAPGLDENIRITSWSPSILVQPLAADDVGGR